MSKPATASPRTNFDAPSMAPKKADSCSTSARRRFAVSSSIKPADKSASIAICLPGIESKAKRAATSAIRPEPFVMTTKLTMTRMAKTMTPMMTLPCITKLPKASITPPAASVPSCPLLRINRVEARFNARRSMVAISKTVGKALNSNGRLMKRAVIKTRNENVNEIASEKSNRNAGRGRMSTTRMIKMPEGRTKSLRLASCASIPSKLKPPPAGDDPVVEAVEFVVVTSLMNELSVRRF